MIDEWRLNHSITFRLTRWLETIEHENEKYNFSYDKYGNLTEISDSGDESLEKNRYGKRNGKLKSTSVGGGKLSYRYNKYEQIEAEKWNDGKTSYYRYDNNGNLSKVNDTGNDLVYSYNYDDAGRITDATVESGKGKKRYESLALQNTYDNSGRIESFSYRYSDTAVKTSNFKYRASCDFSISATISNFSASSSKPSSRAVAANSTYIPVYS